MPTPKQLLTAHHIDARKSLGQNFLSDPGALDKIVAVAEIQPGDSVLEIGPGTGVLTERLAQVASRVVAVELDQRLRPVLDAQLASFKNVEVIYQDILTVNIPQVMGAGGYVVVANVPYYITSAIFRQLLEPSVRPRRTVLTIQQEVAERIIATPPDMNVLAVSVQYYGKPQIVGYLKAGAFWPRPDVDSAIIRVDTYDTPQTHIPDEKRFFRIVRSGFGQKRKQLKNSLSGGMALPGDVVEAWLRQAGIDPTRRAETLTLSEWAALAQAEPNSAE